MTARYLEFDRQSTTIQHNLSTIHREHLGKKQTILFERAMRNLPPQLNPWVSRDLSYGVGLEHYENGNFRQAYQAFIAAHQAVEILRSELTQEELALAQENAEFYARLVHCCIEMKNEVAAFEYAVASKGRVFVNTLANGDFDIFAHLARNSTLAADWATYLQLRQEINDRRVALNDSNTSFQNSLKYQLEIIVKREKLEREWEKLNLKYPKLTATQQVPTLTVEQACQLAQEMQATLVEYVKHFDGWSAFVVSKDRFKIQHVSLDSVDEEFLTDMTDWIELLEKKNEVAWPKWITHKRLTQLHMALIEPLQEYLPPAGQGERLILAPFGQLHQLPLNAARNPESKHYLTQEYTLTFTPSLAALRTSLDEAYKINWQWSQPKRPLHISYSGHQDMREGERLQKGNQSAAKMSDIFADTQPLSEEQATSDRVATHVLNRDALHFHCHCTFNPDTPEQWGLLLHDGFLTMSRIITDLDLSQTHVTTLAACRSGRVRVRQGEELVGLIQALLIAKSKAVVTTLWQVSESSTQALFHYFYTAIKNGYCPADALTQAVWEIRQPQNWPHPYYWAAFQISGLAYEM